MLTDALWLGMDKYQDWDMDSIHMHIDIYACTYIYIYTYASGDCKDILAGIHSSSPPRSLPYGSFHN